MVGSTLGPYLVVEKLGAGGMGEVYLAFDTRLNRRVALKSLSERGWTHGQQPAARLLNEARAAAGLSHPGIAAIYDIVESGPRPFIVMEYVQGETLAARVQRGPLQVPDVLAIGVQLAGALAHAHDAGIVHGDLKPGNVMLEGTGVAKILDFGLATWRPLDETDGKSLEETTRERVESLSGTPAYMAPEQLLGHPASPRSDIYSLGILLYELLSGRRPYEAPDFVSLALAIISGRAPALDEVTPSIPADVTRVVSRAMAKEPRERYESAAALAADLRRLDASHREAASADASRRDAPPTDAASPETASREAAHADVEPRDAPPTDAASREAASADASRRDAPPTDAASREAAHADVEHRAAAPTETAGTKASNREAARADAAPLDASPRDASRREAATVRRASETMPVAPSALRRPWLQSRPALLGAGVVLAATLVFFFALWPGWRRPAVRPFDGQLAVGVVPLANLTGDATRDYIGIGISESLLTALAAVPALTVRSGNETTTRRTGDVQTLSRDLGVKVVLTGAVQSASGVLHFSVKALEADGTVIWAREYRGPPEAQFQMQATVARDLTEALSLAPTVAERARMSAPPSASVDAYAEYAKGRGLLDRLDVPGNLAGAISAFERAVAKDPQFALAHAGLGEAWWARYRDENDPSLARRALDAIERAVGLDPASARIKVTLATVQLGTGRTAEAAGLLREVVSDWPNEDDAHRLLARALGDQGDLDGALRGYQRAIAIRPGYWRNHSALGSYYYRQGRYAEAAIAYQRVTELVPDGTWGFMNLGAAYFMAGDKPRALDNFQRALAIDPDDAVALSNVGTLLYSQARYAEAAGAFSRAVRLQPGNAVNHANLGDAYKKLGRESEAREAYRSAVRLVREQLEVNPRAPQHLSRCALYLAKLGESAEALELARAAVEAGGDVEAIYRRAAVHALLGQQAEAVAWLERAIAEGYSVQRAREDDDLASVHSLPRVQALLKDVR